MITSWPLTKPFYPALDAEGRDVQAVRRFEPDVGPPIERPSSLATLEAWSMTAHLKSRDDYATFMAWWRDDLARGTLPFVWRHPRSRAVGKWKFTGPPSHRQTGAERVQVSFDCLLLPGSVWFADYVPQPYARIPAWVADYDGGVYGVGDARGVVGDLAAVSGTYEVWQKNSDGTHEFKSVTYAANIPATAPAGVDWLVGFDL